jgi:hypothetical protein
MEKEPQISKSQEAIKIEEHRERIRQIDAAIIALESGINRIPQENEQGTSSEDDSLEGEANEVSFGLAENESSELRAEKQRLEQELDRLLDIEQKAA